MSELTLKQKKHIKYLLLWITTLGQASVVLYLPSLPMIAHDLFVSNTDIKQTITLFIIGFGISPMIYGPFSDRYGRKPILVISLVIGLLGYIFSIMSYKLLTFDLSRLIQGLGCGGILISGRAIVRDVFSGRELASASSYLSMGFAIGFGASPSLGGLIGYHLGWRFNFVFLLLVMIILIFVVLILLPETLKNKKIENNILDFTMITIIDYYQILRNTTFIRYLIGGFFAYSVVMAYNIMTPFLFQQIFLLTPSEYGYVALCMGIPYYVAASMNRSLVLKYGVGPMFIIGYTLIIFSGGLIIVFTFLMVTKLQYIIVPMMMATFGQALIFSNTISAALQQFNANYGGKTSAIFSSLQMISVSIFSAIIASIPSRDSMPFGIVVFSLGLLSMLVLGKQK